MKKRFTLYTCLIALCVLHAPINKAQSWLDFPKNHPYLCTYIGGLAAFSIVSGIIQAKNTKNSIQVGVIPVIGEIKSTKKLVDYTKAIFDNPSVKAIVIEINSPGGDAAYSQALFEEIVTLKKQHNKPVIALVESTCASGGYYIACSADTIIAPRAATIGSIGVISAGFNIHRLLEKFNIDYTVVKSGKNKTTRNPYLPIDHDNNQILQACIDDLYKQFTHDVANQRPNISLENSEQWAEGKLFSGQQALDLGLIDQFGSWTAAENLIKEKLETTEKIQWLYPKPPSFFERMAQQAPNMIAQTIAQLNNTTISTHI